MLNWYLRGCICVFLHISVYKSPDYECLGFDLVKQQLVKIGYPESLVDFEYDPTFPIRLV